MENPVIPVRIQMERFTWFISVVIPVDETREIFSIIWSICVDPIPFFGVEKKLPVPLIAVFVRKFSPKGKFHEICPIPTRSVVLDISSLKFYWRNVA